MRRSTGVMSVSKAEFAWPEGDVPGSLDFPYELSPSLAQALGRTLAPMFPPAGDKDSRYRALAQNDDPVGRYKLSTKEGEWFVRVSSRWGNPGFEKPLVDHLAARGVAVNPLLVANLKLQWEEQTFRVDVRPLIKGRHFNGSPEDLYNLASTLAQCHRSLQDISEADQVYVTAAARARRLESIRHHITDALASGNFELFAERASWASAHVDWLSQMVEKFDSNLHERPDAQCVHGEIHPGNVLFRIADSVAVLVDFEESVHIFMPPAWDLAFMAQRFCLKDDPTPSIALDRLAAVTEGYGEPLPELAPTMRQAAWFTMAVILDLRISRGRHSR